jgi:hypothetical protein
VALVQQAVEEGGDGSGNLKLTHPAAES